MSSSIWMQCAGISELRPLSFVTWRVVEAQHLLSTRKLVDSAAEQVLLEEMIDNAKPRDGTEGRIHYLLFTPFRYPPLRHGSRFGTRRERGVWYGSEQQQTAFAEVAYYRLLFFEGTRAVLSTVTATLTAFTVRVRSERAIDLAAKPFNAHRAIIAAPNAYVESQTLGTAMREAGVDFFRYPSARDAAPACNIGVFSPAAFHRAKPQKFETWHCIATNELVEFASADFRAHRARHSFERVQFEVGGVLPAPALG
ncbi:MAG: RES family NAD+ phosphorylase [Gemmatimonas sp.]